MGGSAYFSLEAVSYPRVAVAPKGHLFAQNAGNVPLRGDRYAGIRGIETGSFLNPDP
jgi:hypothetical protein